MKNLLKVMIVVLLLADTVFVGFILLNNVSIPLLQPQGIIALKQKNLLMFATALSAIALIPVFLMTFFITFHFRESNKKAKYTPEWDHNKKIQTLWWLFPIIIIFILGVVNVKSTHELDPFKPIDAQTKPITIQVIALQWKWVFIYPEYNIATVNFLAFPEKTPLDIELTADAPMNSFWIPHLGGQIYAMEGMITKTHLMADTTGEFPGSSAEISGEGFVNMRFTAKSTTHREFTTWVESVRNSTLTLDQPTYDALVQPGENHKPIVFSSVKEDLFKQTVMKFMIPPKNPDNAHRLEHDLMEEGH